GDKDVEVFYPTANLNNELWEDRAFNDFIIGQEDERWILQNTFAKLQAYMYHTFHCNASKCISVLEWESSQWNLLKPSGTGFLSSTSIVLITTCGPTMVQQYQKKGETS
ncbi:hypothetical protein K443DRAFT_95632, partial [Laccaria amethystina LaAM-08-1]